MNQSCLRYFLDSGTSLSTPNWRGHLPCEQSMPASPSCFVSSTIWPSIHRLLFKVIVSRVADSTFLPRFQTNKNGTEGHFAEKQNHVVFAHTYWDTVLVRTATQWKKGEIFILDVNAILMDQIMERQMRSDGIADAFGNGKQRPLFQHVEQPCLQTRLDSHNIRLQPAVVDKCTDPAAHLFWCVNVHKNTMFHPNQIVGMTYA